MTQHYERDGLHSMRRIGGEFQNDQSLRSRANGSGYIR